MLIATTNIFHLLCYQYWRAFLKERNGKKSLEKLAQAKMAKPPALRHETIAHKSRQQTVRLQRLLIVEMIRRRTKLAARSLRVEPMQGKAKIVD